MKIDPEHSRIDAARKPQDLRTMLLGSTTIPALGMTIADASQKTAGLLAGVNAFGSLSDERVNAIHAEVNRLETAVIALEPQTILDAACILDRVFPIDARANLDRDIPALRRVAAFLRQAAETARTASPAETSVIPSIGMTFRQAADRVRELVERANSSPKGEDDNIEDKAELERREAARIADCHEWCRIIDAMMATPAQTIGDLFAKLERIACTSLGIRHLVFVDEEIALLEEDVQRLQPLWSGLHLAARAGEPSQDAPIFAAHSRWSELVRDCYAATTDEDCEFLSEQADQAALDVMTHEPTTRDGLAAQVFVMLHLEHGGSTADHLDIGFSALTGGDGPDSAAVQALVERVKRLGRRDRGDLQSADTGLYARWVEVRARFLADELSDEESDALKVELDRIEDRLESEPARCVADAIVKLAYFLTASNSMLDDGILPSIDAAGSTAWPRLLFTVEDAAELLAVDAQAPFRAMVAGLRQLMQRHVKLEEETDRQPGGRHDADLFAAYDALLKAMRAESVLPESASDEEREPHEQAMEAAADHLVALAPATPRGAAILLRYLFLRNCSTIEAERAFLRGDEPNEEDLTDYQSLILWRTVKMLEALPAAANDQRQDADAFADTVAAFEAEAPTTLALPLEPTGRMVDAGASAAGITPAQFQAAYAAAVEALKLERAA